MAHAVGKKTQDVYLESWGETGRMNIIWAYDDRKIGDVDVEFVNGNVVVTVRRVDEALFGPVSLVVV